MACKSESKKIQFETFVILDIGSTGIPDKVDHEIEITELSLVAVKREHVLATSPDEEPQVQDQLNLLFDPEEKMTTTSTYPLRRHPDYTTFNIEAFNLINSFFNNLTKPICLIAHNGHRFDFPILKKYLLALDVNFDSDLRYADSLYGLYDIMEGHGTQHLSPYMANRYDVGRYYEPGNFIQSYSLQFVYERIFPHGIEHELPRNASIKCFMVLKLFVFKAREMVEWFDTHNLLFSEVDVANVIL